MSVNVVELVMRFLTPEMIAKIANTLGLDRTATQKAVIAMVPAILAAIARKAASPAGARAVSDMFTTQDPSLLGELGQLIGGAQHTELIAEGRRMAAELIGADMSGVIGSAIARHAAITDKQSGDLLGVLAPVAIGSLALQQSTQKLDAAGLASLLAAQSDAIAQAMPAGLMALLGGPNGPAEGATTPVGGQADMYKLTPLEKMLYRLYDRLFRRDGGSSLPAEPVTPMTPHRSEAVGGAAAMTIAKTVAPTIAASPVAVSVIAPSVVAPSVVAPSVVAAAGAAAVGSLGETGSVAARNAYELVPIERALFRIYDAFRLSAALRWGGLAALVLLLAGGGIWMKIAADRQQAALAEQARIDAAAKVIADAKAKADAEARATAKRTADAKQAADIKAKADSEAAAARRAAEMKAAEAKAAEAKAAEAAEIKARAEAQAALAADRLAAAEADARRKAELDATTMKAAAVSNAAPAALAVDDQKVRADLRACQSAVSSAAASGHIQFEVASATLATESSATLERLAAAIKSCPQAKVRIEGHTDADGDEGRNKTLSEHRAKSVTEYLSRSGIPAERLSAVGLGSAHPVVPNDTPENKLKNRRIEFVIDNM